jgi:hypothetical protein
VAISENTATMAFAAGVQNDAGELENEIFQWQWTSGALERIDEPTAGCRPVDLRVRMSTDGRIVSYIGGDRQGNYVHCLRDVSA